MDKEMAPVFVKIENYKEVLDIIDVIKNKVYDVKETLDKVNELRAQENDELELWNKNADEIIRKISFIDKTLFEPNE